MDCRVREAWGATGACPDLQVEGDDSDVNSLAMNRPTNMPTESETHVGSRLSGLLLLGCIVSHVYGRSSAADTIEVL